MWTYATCGMSHPGDRTPLEMHLFSPVEDVIHVETLTVIAHYHRTGAPLGPGHTVNLGRPWLDAGECRFGLVSRPYLDGPELEWWNRGATSVQFLWLIPITKTERDFAKQNGLEALERRFEQSQFDYLDPQRASVV